MVTHNLTEIKMEESTLKLILLAFGLSTMFAFVLCTIGFMIGKDKLFIGSVIMFLLSFLGYFCTLCTGAVLQELGMLIQ